MLDCLSKNIPVPYKMHSNRYSLHTGNFCSLHLRLQFLSAFVKKNWFLGEDMRINMINSVLQLLLRTHQ